MGKDKKSIVPPEKTRASVVSYLESFRSKYKDPGAIFTTAGGEQSVQKIEAVPSHIPSLDLALGGFGLPRGRVIELFGPESTGKTTLAMQFAIEAQRLGGYVHFIDAEHAIDLEYMSKLGYDQSLGLISQPDCGEDALNYVEFAIRNQVDVVIVDSVACLTPKAEIEGEMGESHMGLQARLMSQALRKLTLVPNNRTVTIFINQLRQKIGVVFGNPETTPGGNALKFYASVRLDVRRVSGTEGIIKKGEETIGHKLRIKVVKNKVAPPFRSTEVTLLYGHGFDMIADLLSVAITRGVVTLTGSWYNFNGDRLGNGFDQTRAKLVETPAIADQIEAAILAAPPTR
jgi:recombination protein RecA